MTRLVVREEEGYEPITVVEVPERYIRRVASGDAPIYFNIPLIPSPIYDYEEPTPLTIERHYTTVRFQGVHKGRDLIYWDLVALDPESALRLKAAFLPGQLGEVQRREAEAFLRGAFLGLA